MSYNQRNYTRIEVDFSVTVSPGDGEPAFEATLTNISAGGFRIEHAQKPAAGIAVQCSFFNDSYQEIEVRGTVISVTADGFGVELSGYDCVSYAHLRQLLVSRADDSHAVENEILLNLDVLPLAD